MAGKALKASGKRVMKYSRDGAVARDLAESSESRISDRTEDAVLKVEHTDERFNSHGTVPEQVIPDHSDGTNEIPQDSFIIENLFAEFYGSDDAAGDSAKPSGKFEFRKNEQAEGDTDKKRKLSRFQEETKADSKLKTEAVSTSLKQDTEKSSLAFVSAVAVDGDAADSAEEPKSKRRTALKDKREDALSEESENADTLKFEHTGRSLEKQSHFADKLSDGSAASKKLKANKGIVEEVSAEDRRNRKTSCLTKRTLLKI